ncbi:type II and III secretion system protein family protein [Sphingomonas sp.]|uniref:type II and III secretion system protein family protein n=1 Tax=Sphingomonas sp. TaxID=28214 RepID=UPI002CD79F26|nr:type II and III secretion system protein family protein [Sphingomonas sp.]HWK35852.1 type II and III secretion system protein family protein [Sphingomonas sp.]
MRFSLEPMRLPLAIALAATTFVAAPVATTAQTVSTQSFPLVEVNTSRGRMVTLTAPISDVFVADPAIADVQVRSPTQIYIFGKAPGETTVSATTKAGRVVYATTVRVGTNYSSIQQMLSLAMPESQVTATTMNGLVLLTGVVAQPNDAAEAERLVQAFVGDKIKVLSRLKTATPLQVNLQVKIAEVSRSFLKTIGNNLQAKDTTGGFQFGIASGRTVGTSGPADISGFPLLDASSLYGLPAGSLSLPFNPATGSFVLPGTGKAFDFTNLKPASSTARTALGLAGHLLGLDVLSAIDLGETNGQVTTLANPNLTVLSGETSSFLAGGEIPIPIATGLGAVSIEYKQYGVSLAYTPTVLADGRISMRVRPEVSQLSTAGAVVFQGTQIPSLTTRRTETTVELGSGESMVISGLLSNSHDNQIDKTPGLGDVPILGAMFRSNGYKRNETELVIVVTPYLVKPVNANQIVLPTDGYKGPTDLQRVFMGSLSGGQSGEDRPKPSMVTPSAPSPSIGAVAPAGVVPTAPTPGDQRREAVATTPVAEPRKGKDKIKKGAGATPGFSFR